MLTVARDRVVRFAYRQALDEPDTVTRMLRALLTGTTRRAA